MTAQPDLFSYSPPSQNWRRTDPDTSQEAGLSARHFIGEHHRKILDVLRSAAGPMAAEQIADELGWINHVPANRRLSELERQGVIRAVDKAHRNRSGRAAQRYVLMGTAR